MSGASAPSSGRHFFPRLLRLKCFIAVTLVICFISKKKEENNLSTHENVHSDRMGTARTPFSMLKPTQSRAQ
jgi:hypothetical protein